VSGVRPRSAGAGSCLAGSKTSKHADLVLAAVPLVCIYVDLLCMNLNLRILALAAYMRQAETVDVEHKTVKGYEQFIEKKAERATFALEDWAINWGTRVLSLAVALYGGFGAGYGNASAAVTVAFIASGVFGLATSAIVEWRYRKRRAKLENASKTAQQ
jgi:hypothetical protein